MKLLKAAPRRKRLYAVLSVTEDATADEIRDAFLRIARAHHPDVAGGVCDEIYKQAAHAYSVLRDPEARAEYDMDGIDPAEKPAGLLRVALAVITKHAFNCIADGITEYTNLPEKVRGAIRRDLAQLPIEIRRIDSTIAAVRKGREAIARKWKGAEDAKAAILAMIDTQLAADEQAKLTAQGNTEILELALRVLESATYETEPEFAWGLESQWRNIGSLSDLRFKEFGL